MPNRVRHGTGEDFHPLSSRQEGPNPAEPLFAGQMIVVGPVRLVNIRKQTCRTALKLAANGIPAAKAAGQHGPVKVVATPAKRKWALEQIPRIRRSDKVDR